MATHSSPSVPLGNTFGKTLLACAPVLFFGAIVLLLVGLFGPLDSAYAAIALGVSSFGFTVVGGLTLVANEATVRH